MQKIQKNYLIFDIEVFPSWWCIVFSTTSGFQSHYSCDDLNYLINIKKLCSENILVGFNIKNYDMKILHAILSGEQPYRIYQLSKSIILDRPDPLNNIGWWNSYYFSDLFDDWKNGSLKEYEANKGLNIKESNISFDQAFLTEEDKKETLKYCCHDVYATTLLFKDRDEYINAKLELAELFNINPYKALKSTNAKLASIILQASYICHGEEELYVLPEKAKAYIEENLPSEIIEAFKILNYDEKIFNIYDNKVVFGIGGIHSTYSVNLQTHSDDEYQLINVDVTSYYPNLLMEFMYMSRNTPKPELYKHIYNLRRKLKEEASEEKNTNGKTEKYYKLQAAQTGLKLILNTVYGAMKNKYNDLYDPYMARSLCYTGQLLLAALANKLYKNIVDIKIIQTNTDGILVKCPIKKIDELKKLVSEWEQMVGFTMEYDYIKSFYQRDVNNYIEVTGNPNDPYKLKGKWSNQAITDEVETNLNAPVTHLALLKYYTENIPVEETILSHTEPLDFCFTTKTGRTYSKTCYELNNKFIDINKVNRVVATLDKSKGSLYKYKPSTDELPVLPENANKKEKTKYAREIKKRTAFETKYGKPFGRMDKIAEIPEHCELINEDVILPDNIDKMWYVAFCKDKIKELVCV